MQHFETYCFDCHDDASMMGGLDMVALLDQDHFDPTILFEHLISAKMPPKKKKQPGVADKQMMLDWLASRQTDVPGNYRRISRHEFVNSVNDLLGTTINLADQIPEDRGTYLFDSDRRIQLTREQLTAFFAVADGMLEFAFPAAGFHPEQVWTTSSVKESHKTYRSYARKHKEGMLFSWTRANNGRLYSFFYDHFDPPVKGWYDLTFDAAKMGNFPEDISIMIFAGKYFLSDARPQPRRLLEVISLGSKDVKPYTVRVFLNPGENVSVHCYSKHTWRQAKGEQGAYIKQMTARGPVFDTWPPKSYQTVFAGLPIKASDRTAQLATATPPANQVVRVASTSGQEMKAVIKRFAEKAFSSVLNEDELAPYYQVSHDHFRARGDFVAAAKIGLKAVISSHRFLLAPGVHPNESFENAAALARTLWLSVPDRQLRDTAQSDELSKPAIKIQIERMLMDKKSRRMIHSFCAQWLDLRLLNKVSPSLKLYPLFNELLNYYLPIETEAYMAYLIEHNLPVTYLVDSDFSILNQRLAQHYGIDGVIGQQMRKVAFPPNSPRGGLMTMGSVLMVTADGFDTSPILRGAWISKNIVGTTLSPPPPNVGEIEPDLSQSITLKERIAKHKKSKTCYACHKSIDPYGFALENFDATGQWRTQYRAKTKHKATFQYRQKGYYKLAGEVDASGEIDATKFDDVIGLKELLVADHKKVAYNFVKKYFEYASGYSPSLEQRVELHNLIPEKPEDCRLRDLIRDVLMVALRAE